MVHHLIHTAGLDQIILQATLDLSTTFNLDCYTNGSLSCNTAPGGHNKVTEFNNLPDQIQLSQAGITATFKGKYFAGGVSFSNNMITSHAPIKNGKIGSYSQGAGVNNSPYDDHQADGDDRFNDFIQASFDKSVKVTEVVFGLFSNSPYGYQGPDSFRWLYDKSANGSIGVGDHFSDEIGSNPFSGFGGAESDLWAFAAFTKGSEWKLKSITVEYHDPDGSPGVIPLPAAGWMLLSALGGMGALRRYRKG